MSLTLDIETAAVDVDGMRGFYWPLRIDASVPVREFLYSELIPLIRTAEVGDPGALTLRVTHQYLIMATLRLFEAIALASAFTADGVRPAIPRRFEMLRAVLEGVELPLVILPSLTAGPPSSGVPSRVKRLFRAVQWNRPYPARVVRSLAPWADKDVVFTPDVNTLLVDHARREGRALRFSPLDEWFTAMPAVEAERVGAAPVSGSLAPAVEIVVESFHTGGIPRDTLTEEWANRWLQRAHAFVQFHASELQARTLPGEMWFSCTGATIWSRMLALAVREQGGYVTAHDHGYGNAQVEQSDHHFTEFHFSDEFHTYNELQAHVRRREIQDDLLLDARPLLSAPPLGNGRVPAPGEGRRIAYRGRIRRLMYIPTAFHAMRVRLRPIFPDPVALDFQARLFGHLREWGIEVLYKPHPGGGSRPPDGFAERFGFETDLRPFEEVDWDCDAYLVDFLRSSTTRDVLASEKPVIFLDMPYPELLPEARSLLERRCAFVDIESGPDHRLHADWARLQAILNAETHELDMTFPDAYYEGTDL